MLRWLFIILLLLNGIYYVWANHLAPAPVVDEGQYILPASARTLVLVGESSQAELDQSISSGAPSASLLDAGAAGVGRGDECWMVGPIVEDVTARQLMAKMKGEGVVGYLKSRSSVVNTDYWVLIPPAATYELAMELLRGLQAKKIDSFLITDGEWKNGISLGFFTQKAKAEVVFRRRLSQGYQAVMEPVERKKNERWLVLEAGQEAKITADFWKKLLNGTFNIEKRKKFCNTIAFM